MRLLTLVGVHAGTVREFPYHIARQLLADGRAERVDETPVAIEPEPTSPAAPRRAKARR